MDKYTSTEEAYKNGYAAGYRAACIRRRPEPRVLSLDELREATDYPIYLEAPHEYPCGYEDYVFLSYFSNELETVVFLVFGEEEAMRLPIIDYGKQWRVWSDKPTRKVKVSQEWQK